MYIVTFLRAPVCSASSRFHCWSCEFSSQSPADPAQHSHLAARPQIPWVLVMWSLPCAASASHCCAIATTASLGNTRIPSFPALNGSPGNSVHLLLLPLLLYAVCCLTSVVAGKMMDGDVREYFCFSKISKISWSGIHGHTAEFVLVVVSQCSWTFSVGTIND